MPLLGPILRRLRIVGIRSDGMYTGGDSFVHCV